MGYLGRYLPYLPYRSYLTPRLGVSIGIVWGWWGDKGWVRVEFRELPLPHPLPMKTKVPYSYLLLLPGFVPHSVATSWEPTNEPLHDPMIFVFQSDNTSSHATLG